MAITADTFHVVPCAVASCCSTARLKFSCQQPRCPLDKQIKATEQEPNAMVTNIIVLGNHHCHGEKVHWNWWTRNATLYLLPVALIPWYSEFCFFMITINDSCTRHYLKITWRAENHCVRHNFEESGKLCDSFNFPVKQIVTTLSTGTCFRNFIKNAELSIIINEEHFMKNSSELTHDCSIYIC